MKVEITINGLRGRHLTEPDRDFRFSRDYIADSSDWVYKWEGTLSRSHRAATRVATDASQSLFSRFGLDLSPEILARVQARIGRYVARAVGTFRTWFSRVRARRTERACRRSKASSLRCEGSIYL